MNMRKRVTNDVVPKSNAGQPTSLVIPVPMLTRLKRTAAKLGVPVATHIKSIIHQYHQREDRRAKRGGEE